MTGFLTAALGYLLGSIPFGFILVRIFRGKDVRQTGSGNIGATNVLRTSPGLGILTLLLDALKGSAAVMAAFALSQHEIATGSRSLTPEIFVRATIAALFAILGHMFPVWLKFRGGKGVATALGSFAILAPKTVLVLVGIFVAVVVVLRYVSLGSMVAIALFPALAWRLHEYADAPQIISLMAIASALIIAKHHQNIRRIAAGTEPRFQWKTASRGA